MVDANGYNEAMVDVKGYNEATIYPNIGKEAGINTNVADEDRDTGFSTADTAEAGDVSYNVGTADTAEAGDVSYNVGTANTADAEAEVTLAIFHGVNRFARQLSLQNDGENQISHEIVAWRKMYRKMAKDRLMKK